jgi:hypothetical protein
MRLGSLFLSSTARIEKDEYLVIQLFEIVSVGGTGLCSSASGSSFPFSLKTPCLFLHSIF